MTRKNKVERATDSVPSQPEGKKTITAATRPDRRKSKQMTHDSPTSKPDSAPLQSRAKASRGQPQEGEKPVARKGSEPGRGKKPVPKEKPRPVSTPETQAKGQRPAASKRVSGARRAKTSVPPKPAPTTMPQAVTEQPAIEAPTIEPSQAPAVEISNEIVIPSTISVRDLAALMKRSPIDVIKELMKNGVMANINQQIDYETAAIVAEDMGFRPIEERPPEPEVEEAIEETPTRRQYTAEEVARLTLRPPVVTVMGHVDHGKTSLLDAIRETNVAAGEAGSITQHIGAYQVQHHGRKITFLDTPGHEAFTAMRARGAKVTDIAVLVVAADDGVMPQTLEAIDHARAARVPIIVALNKIDKENANPDLVKQQLADAGLVIEEFGGDVVCVPVSAKKHIGIDALLEMILLVADVQELRALPDEPARGTVIEAELDKTKGPVATLLVQEGTLRLGDFVVIGETYGKVRALFDDKGERLESAGPSTPVLVLGLEDVPVAGESFRVVKDEREARSLAHEAAMARRETEQRPTKRLTLDEIYAQAAAGQVKELNIILKADVQGSIEPIVSSVEKLSSEKLKVKFLRQSIGNITESDIMLAVASNAIVIGFGVSMDTAAARAAEANGVDVRFYDIIYKLVDDIDKALQGLLEPVYQDVTIGHAEVRAIFHIRKRGNVAGCLVTDGQAARNAKARVWRDGQVLFDGGVASLRRFTEDVREVAAGLECGIGLDGFDAFQEGDVIEFYRKERVS
ncbi:MAG: translation initiation factor IF-2 [Chloroflexi bacterium]|nr:translation initiation factor IF-2 [Chloroflexota bacterium]